MWYIFFCACVLVGFGLFFVLPVQGERLRNLIVSESADWQVLTLRLAVNLQSLKRAVHEDAGKKASEQVGGRKMWTSSVPRVPVVSGCIFWCVCVCLLLLHVAVLRGYRGGGKVTVVGIVRAVCAVQNLFVCCI